VQLCGVLNSKKSGRIYRRGSVEHIASAAGEPPASNTGRLVNSIATEYDQAALAGRVVVGVDYGLMLEYGTQKIEPRPFLRPAVANVSGDIQRIIQEEINRELAR
jgi:HK97 gp10 family phage protein